MHSVSKCLRLRLILHGIHSPWRRSECVMGVCPILKRAKTISSRRLDCDPRSSSLENIRIFLLLSFSRSRFFSRFSCFLCLLSDIYIPLAKIHEIDSFTRFLAHVRAKRTQSKRPRNFYKSIRGYIRIPTKIDDLSLRPGLWINYSNS